MEARMQGEMSYWRGDRELSIKSCRRTKSPGSQIWRRRKREVLFSTCVHPESVVSTTEIPLRLPGLPLSVFSQWNWYINKLIGYSVTQHKACDLTRGGNHRLHLRKFVPKLTGTMYQHSNCEAQHMAKNSTSAITAKSCFLLALPKQKMRS